MWAAAANARLQGDRENAENFRWLLGRDLHTQHAGRFRRDDIVSRADGGDGFRARLESARTRSPARVAQRQARWLRTRSARDDAFWERAGRSDRRMPVR